MSIRLMARVWDSSQYAGGTLLVLLALADFANDRGERIFPYLETLAEKARLSEKQTRRTLETLISDQVVKNDGEPIGRGSVLNLRLNLGHDLFRDKLSPGHGVQGSGHLEPDAGTFAPPERDKMSPHIDNHQVTHQENHQGEPPCVAVVVPDLDLAVAAFNEAAKIHPKWIRCRDVTANRRKVINARLAKHGLVGWRTAVTLAANSRFLGGPVPIHGDHQGWRMDIAWFAAEKNFAKITEGGFPQKNENERLVGRDSARAGLMDFLRDGPDEEIVR